MAVQCVIHNLAISGDTVSRDLAIEKIKIYRNKTNTSQSPDVCIVLDELSTGLLSAGLICECKFKESFPGAQQSKAVPYR